MFVLGSAFGLMDYIVTILIKGNSCCRRHLIRYKFRWIHEARALTAEVRCYPQWTKKKAALKRTQHNEQLYCVWWAPNTICSFSFHFTLFFFSFHFMFYLVHSFISFRTKYYKIKRIFLLFIPLLYYASIRTFTHNETAITFMGLSFVRVKFTSRINVHCFDTNLFSSLWSSNNKLKPSYIYRA